jgi:hypothetical protein
LCCAHLPDFALEYCVQQVRQCRAMRHRASISRASRISSSSPSLEPIEQLTTRRCRSFSRQSPKVCQKRALDSIVPRVASAPSIARPRVARTQSIHVVMSIVGFCVRSRMSSNPHALAGSGPTCCGTVENFVQIAPAPDSAIARAILPLPSSKGWIVTNKR